MASGTPQQQQQQSQHQHQQQHEHMMQQQHNNRMQFAPNHVAAATICPTTNFDLQQQQMHPHNSMSPNTAQMPINHGQGHLIPMNPHLQQHHHHHQQPQLMRSAGMVGQAQGNQATSHIQQKSQILPLLLSPRPPSLTPNSNDQNELSENDHESIIDQVISLENEFSDTSGMLGSVDSNAGLMINQQHQQHHLGDINLSEGICIPDSNQFSSSSEDLLNLLLEFDREPSNLIGLSGGQQLDLDEKVGIETIRKQLMSCEVQSEQLQHRNTNSMSPIVNQMTCQPQQTRSAQESRNSVHQQQQVTQQLISQPAPVIPHHQQSHQMSASGPSQQQHQLISNDQSMLHSSYSNVPMSTVPVSASGQSYAPQQQQVTRISNPMPIVNSSPSPSWQQPQLSPYSPQPPHNNSRTPSQRQGQQHHSIHQQQQHQLQSHQNTTSPQMQQPHHTLQQRSPSQSVSPPATTEPSPVVKKNPLLNAQLVNSRAPSITPTRFMNSQPNVLNQNPILNAKLSQSPFANSSGTVTGSPVNPSLNPQSRFIQPSQQTSNFSFDITQQPQQQQQNAQQRTPLSAGQMNLYGEQLQQQQATNQIFRSTNTSATIGMSTGGGTSITMGNTSSNTGLSQQVKQEIRRKVQQPKQQQQTTSLLKQLLSDDNK